MNTSIDSFFFFAGAKRLDKIQSTLLEYPHRTSFLHLLSTKEKKRKKKEKKKENEDIFPLPNFNLWKSTIDSLFSSL